MHIKNTYVKRGANITYLFQFIKHIQVAIKSKSLEMKTVINALYYYDLIIIDYYDNQFISIWFTSSSKWKRTTSN